MPREIGNPPCYVTYRKSVRDRDNDKCRICGKKGTIVRHIKSQKDYPELRTEVSNGITICRECFNKIDAYLRYKKYLKSKNWGHLLNANK